MALPLGDWQINANGFAGILRIASVDAQGNVHGTLTFQNQPPNQLDNVAFWDDTSKELTFIRVSNPANPSTLQIFTGYWFPESHTQPNGPSELTGSFEAFNGGGGSASRFLYGWLLSTRVKKSAVSQIASARRGRVDQLLTDRKHLRVGLARMGDAQRAGPVRRR